MNDSAVSGLRFAEGDDGTDNFAEEEDFSDELLVVIGFRKGGLVRRVSTGGLARIEEKAGKPCLLM